MEQIDRKNIESVEWNDTLPVAVLCDIDGTLVHNPDKIDLAIAHILDGISLIDYAKIILISDRDEDQRKQTKEWLERNDIEYDLLFMRKSGDAREDIFTKSEFFEENIRGKYNVLCVIDDRPKVVRMWQDVYGFKVLAAGDQRNEF